MPRTARIVAPDFPHHIVQRGNRRMNVFFKPNDYQFYLDLLKEWSKEARVDIWAYCLMPNHVHIVGVPEDTDSLRLMMSQVHKRYTMLINRREEWTGHLWQGRFASYVMDEAYALSAVRYVELNPVRSGLVEKPEDYRWSSARHHIHGVADPVLNDETIRSMVPDWQTYLQQAEHKNVLHALNQR